MRPGDLLEPLEGQGGLSGDPVRVRATGGAGGAASRARSRNLCHQTLLDKGPEAWQVVVDRIQAMFGVFVKEPGYIPERGEITMSYLEHGTRLDLSAAGRGLQQTLLLLAYLQVNPGSVILIDARTPTWRSSVSGRSIAF